MGSTLSRMKSYTPPSLCTLLTTLLLYLLVFSSRNFSSDLTLTRTTRTTIKMSVSTIISCFLFSSQFLSTFASVAVGYAKLNPDNPNECVDPDTGVGHRLGTSWSVSGCGEARCDLRHGTVYISYSYCGAVHAEDGCYLKRDVLMPYPYCCPRSFCPTNTLTDIISNSIDAVFGMKSDEDELQMAAGSVHDTRITPDNNENILQYEATLDNNVDYADDYDWDKIFAQYGSSF